MEQKINLFWFRRDLRLFDNAALYAALDSGLPVLSVFVFDTLILEKLPSRKDARLQFIYRELESLKRELETMGTTLLFYHGTPLEAFDYFTGIYSVHALFCNRDYEPFALERDNRVKKMLLGKGISFHSFKDQVIFEKEDILKDDGSPYTVFTPYSRKWKALLKEKGLAGFPSERRTARFLKEKPSGMPELSELGFSAVNVDFPERIVTTGLMENYEQYRDFPGLAATSRIGIHLRFGTVSIRQLAAKAMELSQVFLNELIWREFFSSILAHFPYVENAPFKKQYANIPWRNQETEFERWCRGETGYPMVDAGMRELNETGFMHNRVRMITASFLSKHLLIDWRWGETVFAEKLLDYELASNNGNWQWAAGCGCDAAPYFRVFNPEIQQRRFDPGGEYVRRWVPEAGTTGYMRPVVEHAAARERALETYRLGLTL